MAGSPSLEPACEHRARADIFTATGGVLLFALSHHHFFIQLILPFPMTSPANTSTSHAIVRAVRASLRLTGSSLELLTLSQLFAVKSDLRQTLAIVNGQIQAIQSSAVSTGDDLKLHN